MEVDVIVLHKDSNEHELQLEMKQQIMNVFNQIYNNVKNDSFEIICNGESVKINYQLSSKKDNMLFLKFICAYTPVKSANIMDCSINKLIKGKHRKDWNIVITYDEVSQLYCCKLMPFLGTFECRTRELVYITIIKIFGVKWYEESFSESLRNTLKGKASKTKLIENALDELTYEQLKEYLFVPFSNKKLSDALDNDLSKERISKMSKEEIEDIIDKCRSISLWDRFFGEYKQFKNFKDKIAEIQDYRNRVMHNKRITKDEYDYAKRMLKSINKLLIEAINLLEEDIYTETRLTDVVSAFGNMFSNILSTYTAKWVEIMKPALTSFGKVVIEAAKAQINVSEVVPKLNMGTTIALKNDMVNIPNETSIQNVVERYNKVSEILTPNVSTVNDRISYKDYMCDIETE